MNHSVLVKALKKHPAQILQALSAFDCDLIHMGLGIATEAGELLTTIKAFTIYGKTLDRENLIEELGDLEFYLEGLRQSLNLSRQECLEANIRKLQKRYSAGTYSNEQAIARADKVDGAA